jgi:hypothetical protein
MLNLRFENTLHKRAASCSSSDAFYFAFFYRRLCKRAFYSLSLRERVGVRDSGCPVRAGVPPPSLLPKGGGTKQNRLLQSLL